MIEVHARLIAPYWEIEVADGDSAKITSGLMDSDEARDFANNLREVADLIAPTEDGEKGEGG